MPHPFCSSFLLRSLTGLSLITLMTLGGCGTSSRSQGDTATSTPVSSPSDPVTPSSQPSSSESQDAESPNTTVSSAPTGEAPTPNSQETTRTTKPQNAQASSHNGTNNSTNNSTNSNTSGSTSSTCDHAKTTVEINTCTKQAQDQADRTLNDVYQQVRNRLDAGAKEQLITTEQAWITFRDAHCQQASQPFSGGTLYASFMMGCLTQTTETRISYLRQELGETLSSDRSYTDIGTVTAQGYTIDCTHPEGTPAEKYCAQLSYKKRDQALNELYQTLETRLDAPAKDLLQKAEKAWIEYRDQQCQFATRDAVGGTGYEGYRNNCLEDLTRDRIEELQSQLDR